MRSRSHTVIVYKVSLRLTHHQSLFFPRLVASPLALFFSRSFYTTTTTMTVVMPAKYLNILALSAIVFVACSFLPTPVTALSIDSNGLHARHAHIGQAFAKRAPRRCRAGPPPAGADPTTSGSTPAVTPVNSPSSPATTPPAPAPSPNYSGQKAGVALANWDPATRAAVLQNFKLRRVSA